MRSSRKLENLAELFRSLDFSEVQAEVFRESRARIALVGPVNAGKSSLYNLLLGWTVSEVHHTVPDLYEPIEESLGLFTLIDLPNVESRPEPLSDHLFPYDGRYVGPDHGLDDWFAQDAPLWPLTDVDLIIFVLDGTAGLRAADYQWLARIRSTGYPMLVALNKIDLLDDHGEQMVQDLRRRLALPIVAISAHQGTNVYDVLLPRILDMCPSLTVPLGREVAACRRQAASRLIRQSAILCGLLGVEPMPLLDAPFQLLVQMRLVMRLAAMHGRSSVVGPSEHAVAGGTEAGLSSIASSTGYEVIAALLSSLGLRYLAQQLIKLIPVIGWLLSGVLGASSTWLIGWAAVTYFERAQNGTPLVRVPGGTLGWLRDRRPELKVPQFQVHLPHLPNFRAKERA